VLLDKINSIVIAGGGTSGWLTAAYLIKNLHHPVEITLVESTRLGPIGVGEGTQPYTTTFLKACGLQPKDWMPNSDASYKLGVEFVGWNDSPFFVDNDSIRTHDTGKGLNHQAWLGKSSKEYFNWLPAYRLAKNNVSPKLTEHLDFVVGSNNSAEAVHFNAIKISETLKNLVKNKIKYYDADILNVISNDVGIVALELSTKEKIKADLYIDCTGFKSLLLEQALDVKHISVEDLLPCDKAVAIPTQYTNPETECHPYTKSTAMTAGWRWTIPTFGRIGNGYVYSSNYISKEAAEKELRDAIQEYNAPAIHLNMKCGYKETIAVKNVIAVGLSAGFVEPLEATGITFTTKTVEILTHYLNSFENQFDSNVKTNINSYFVTMVKEIIAFVFLHYATANKRDTDFWKSFDNKSMPDWITQASSEFVPCPPTDLRKFGVYEMFHSGQWFQLFNACEQYKDNACELTTEELIYHKIHEAMLTTRTDLEIEKYPNHYTFLKECYSKLNQ
jgi:tryptophan halogenase